MREDEKFTEIKKIVKEKKKTWRNCMENFGGIRSSSSEHLLEHLKITEMLHPAFVCIHLEHQRKLLRFESLKKPEKQLKKSVRKFRAIYFFQLILTGLHIWSASSNYEPKVALNQIGHHQEVNLGLKREHLNFKSNRVILF